jgi:molybdate transport system ATP-binding protein
MLGDSMTILHHGRTLQCGPPGDVMARPLSAEVARLLDLGNLFEATIAEQDAAHARTVIDWGGHRLDAAYAAPFKPGDRVNWVIAPEYVILHRRDRPPSQGERENPVKGMLSNCVELGETTNVVIQVERGSRDVIVMNIPTHHARRNQLGKGAEVTVTLMAEGIHLMPWGGGLRDQADAA